MLGAITPEGQSLQSTLRRGWYFESQAFRERMLAVLPKGNANVRVNQGQHYEAAALMRDVAEEKAEKIIVRELSAAGLTEEGLSERSRSEPLKWRTARATRTENHGIPQMSPGGSPWVRFESLPQDQHGLTIQVLTPFLLPGSLGRARKCGMARSTPIASGLIDGLSDADGLNSAVRSSSERQLQRTTLKQLWD